MIDLIDVIDEVDDYQFWEINWVIDDHSNEMNLQRVPVRIQDNYEDHENNMQKQHNRRTVNVVKVHMVGKEYQTAYDQQIHKQNSLVCAFFWSFMLQSYGFVTEPDVSEVVENNAKNEEESQDSSQIAQSDFQHKIWSFKISSYCVIFDLNLGCYRC